MLYFDSLPYGTGSNDLGLDRGQVSAVETGALRTLRTAGSCWCSPMSIFAAPRRIRPNGWRCASRFRSRCSAGFAVAAETAGAAADAGAVLVDATDFFLRDAHGVLDALVKQGPYKLDAARSVIAIDATRVFPKNTEVEAILTFASDAPAARLVRRRGRAGSACTDGARASVVSRVAGAGICTAPLRSARRIFPVRVPRLRGRAGSAAGPTVHRAAPLDQAGSELHQRMRSGQTDSVLRGSRCA